MPKRKREVPVAGDGTKDDGPVGIRQLRTEAKLVHGQKLLNRAFRTAKGFERQKLGRRQKTAASNNDAKDAARINSEIAALKTLDLSAAANSYLNKSLLKSKAVAQSPDLPRPVAQPAQHVSDPAALNVIARLCNSNPVKEALPSILQDIQHALGVEIARGVKAAKKSNTKADKLADQRAKMPAASSSESQDGDEHGFDGFSESAASDDEVEDRTAAFDDRIAGSSDSEDEQSASDDDTQPQKGKAARVSALRAALAGPSPSPSPSPSASPEPSTKRRAATLSRPTTSAFVPSLTTGGYWSGSESEPEDDVDVAPKKNRRGQRARQAIWEKKFGAKAKHVQNNPDGGNEQRDKGWDPRRGATDGPRRFGRGGGMAASRSDRPRGMPSRSAPSRGDEPAKPKHRDDDGPIHPSWAAAKKAKEAKVTAPFQGKKITFD